MNIQNISAGLVTANPGLERKPAGREAQDSARLDAQTSVAAAKEAAASQSLAAVKDPAEADKKLQKAVADLRDAVEPLARDLLFSVDKDTGRTVVKIIDTSTDKVIRQIPSEEALALAKELDGYAKSLGVLVKQQA